MLLFFQLTLDQDAAAAALFTACKIEDTLKKSRDIICAAHNLRLPVNEHLSPDDSVSSFSKLAALDSFQVQIFEIHSRAIIGLERLMLEASSFDFRNRHPQQLVIKLAKHYGIERHSELASTAYKVSLDVYRTFAPLKQTTAALAFACLELAGRLLNRHNDDIESGKDYETWQISRAMVIGMCYQPSHWPFSDYQ
jgi:CTD kinase subunit beta